MASGPSWWAVVAPVLVRPRLWVTALRQALRLARPGWWRRVPFVPLPDREYLRFRMETQYGTGSGPVGADVVQYLEWCRSHERLVRGASR